MFSSTGTKDSDSPLAAAQWPLNPSVYANMANSQVDWASLAQQWIHMKETYAPGQQPDNFPSAPPPPPISGKDFEEKGEAPMEMDKDEEPQVSFSQSPERQTHSSMHLYESNNKNNWNAGNNSSNWSSNFSNTWKQSGFNSDKAASSSLPLKPDNHKSSQNSQQPINSHGYWIKPPHKIPSLLDTIIEPSDPNLMLAHARVMAHRYSDEEDMNLDDDDDTTQTIDAAKRKILPAWIREGLEKMEREKQKQLEKEEEMRDLEKRQKIRRQIEEEALKEMESEKSMVPVKSKFDSDSEDAVSNESADENNFHKPSTSNSSAQKPQSSKKSSSPEPLISYRTREEQFQDLMMAVRRNLTEILLEVTNEEIHEVAKETCSKLRNKAPTAQIQRKTALTSLTGGLGLGIYADSSDDDSNSDNEGRPDDESDSETELQKKVKHLKSEFEKKSREIERELDEEALAEEIRRKERERQVQREQENAMKMQQQQLMHQQRERKEESHYKDGEPHQTLDKNYSKSGRSRDKRPSRFSDPRDTVRMTHLTHVNILTPASNNDFIARVPTVTNLSNPGRPNQIVAEPPHHSSSPTESSSSSGHRHKKYKKHKKSSRKKRKRSKNGSDDNDDANRTGPHEEDARSDRFSVASSSRRSISRSTEVSSTRRSRSPHHSRRDRSRSRESRQRRDRSSERRSRHYRDRSRSKSKDSRRSDRRRSRSRDRHRR